MQKSLDLAILSSILLIIFLIEPLAQFEAVNANPAPLHIASPGIVVVSPDSDPLPHVDPDISLAFYYDIFVSWSRVSSFYYSLDSKGNSTLESQIVDFNNSNFVQYEVRRRLGNLTNGTHNVKVYASFVNGSVAKIMDSTFIVDTTYTPPRAFMLSPLNHTTYNTKQVALILATNETDYTTRYALDSPDYPHWNWTTFKGNITLPTLSEGLHKLDVFLYTPIYHVISDKDHQKIYFEINTNATPTPTSPTSNPTIPEFPSLLILIVLVGLISLSVVKIKRSKAFSKLVKKH
jgi:hypothetical protein